MKSGNIRISRFSEGLIVFKPDYYLNAGKKTITDLIEKGVKCESLSNLSNKLYQGGIFKRIFVKNDEFAYQYLTASDVQRTLPLETAKKISKRYTPWVNEMTLRDNQILVSCAGTGSCGKTALVNGSYSGHIGSQEIIRVEVSKIPYGFLYAYIRTPLIYQYIQSMTYGAAIPRISPDELGKLPVLLPIKSKQLEIHHFILEASKLRVEANKLLTEAVLVLEDKLPNIQFEKIYSSKISSRIRQSSRIEANCNTNSIEEFYQQLKTQDIETKTIRELSEKVYTPGIFKRIRTNSPEKGVPFLSGSDLLDQYPFFQNYLSKKMKNIDNYILREGWIAIQDAGTIGYLTYITKFLDGVSATNNLVRVVPNKDKNYNYYIYCFLKTGMGQKLLKALEYGSVQKHIDNHQVSSFRIPIFEDEFDRISKDVEKAMSNLGKACFMEKAAIDLVEKEIESWQE